MSVTGMTRSKIDAFFEEFKFLANFFRREEVNEVYVSRVSGEVFDQTPRREQRGSLWDSIFLLNQHGDILLNVGVKWIGRKWYRPSTWKEGKIHFPETIAGALIRLGEENAREVQIVLIYDPVINRLKIIKSPKGYNVQSWLEEVRRRDLEAVRAANAAIDQVE